MTCWKGYCTPAQAVPLPVSARTANTRLYSDDAPEKHLRGERERGDSYCMPNGHDKNWIRLCAAIDGFRSRYGRWPVRVRMHEMSLRDFDFLFTREDLARISAKAALVPDEAPMIAEDDSGARYNYGEEGFPERAPDIRAAAWLGVRPKPEPE